MRWVGIGAVAVVLLVVGFLFFGGDDEPSDTVADGSPASTTSSVPVSDGDASGDADDSGEVASGEREADAASNAYTPEFQEASCQFDEPLGREPECGFLVVPQDRADPDGRQVRIHVAIFRSDSADPAPDPVIYLEGGPGGEATSVLSLVFEERFAPFLEDRDLIVFDQRGTGSSEPSLKCEPYRELGLDLLDDLLEPKDSLAREYDVLAACRDDFLDDGVDLSHYNSAAIAADVADLRTALGIDAWNLYGISYGTRLGLTIMRDHPTGVRSVILDSVYPPEVDGVANLPANADRAFEELFAGCADDQACASAFGDVEGRFRAVVEAADANPIEVDVVDFFTGETYNALLDGGDLVGVFFQGLYSESIIPELPQLLSKIEAGDYRDLGNLVSVFVANGQFFSVGMHASVQCFEEIPYSDADATAAAAEEFPLAGRVAAGSITQSPDASDFCALWGTDAGPEVEAAPVESAIPTLVMAGEYDPITPPADGRAVADRLDTATYAEFPGLGHAVSTAHPCAIDVTLAFLADPEAAVDLRCIDSMAGPDFSIPGETSEVGALVPFDDDTAGVTGVVPSDWESVAFGTYARQASALDQTALIQQAIPGGSTELVLGLLGGQLGMEDPEPIDEVDIGDRRWTRYRGDLQGFVADIALTDADGLTYLVVLVSDEAERDSLVDAVLLPVLEAIEAS